MQSDDDIWGDTSTGPTRQHTGPDLPAPNREVKRQRTSMSTNAYDNSVVENTNTTTSAAEKDSLWDF